MSNVFHKSEEVISALKSGELPRGSVIRVQWPSGNSEAVRFHGWSNNKNCYRKVFMVGCNMGWDNGATQWYDLSHAIIRLLKKPEIGTVWLPR